MMASKYTKHYYTEGQRIASKIGGGLSPSIVSYTNQTEPITSNYADIKDALLNMCYRADECANFDHNYTSYGTEFKCIEGLAELDNSERYLYFYHSDHIGSSSFITDASGIASQHLQYLPFGELFVEQRSTANYYTPYKFSGKEKDEETSYSYFGARYYLSDISVWASVDVLRDKYPSMSPFMYCAGNPVMLVDPDGRDIDPTTAANVAKLIDPNSPKYNFAFAIKYNALENDHHAVYSFNPMDDPKKKNGEIIYGDVPYNGQNSSGQYLIGINYCTKGGASGCSDQSSLLEETFHAVQFSEGLWGYDGTTGDAFALDQDDEAQAKVFAAQNTNDPKFKTEKDLLDIFNKKGPDGGIEGVKKLLANKLNLDGKPSPYRDLPSKAINVEKHCDGDPYLNIYKPYFDSSGKSRFTNIIMQKP